jgi:hypothetical protein
MSTPRKIPLLDKKAKNFKCLNWDYHRFKYHNGPSEHSNPSPMGGMWSANLDATYMDDSVHGWYWDDKTGFTRSSSGEKTLQITVVHRLSLTNVWRFEISDVSDRCEVCIRNKCMQDWMRLRDIF